MNESVRLVRFPGRQNNSAGGRQVQKVLRRTLLKYRLHQDQELFDRAYGYIKQYYGVGGAGAEGLPLNKKSPQGLRQGGKGGGGGNRTRVPWHFSVRLYARSRSIESRLSERRSTGSRGGQTGGSTLIDRLRSSPVGRGLLTVVRAHLAG